MTDDQTSQEGPEPMTAQPTTPEAEVPFPRDAATGMPVPPAPTAEEEAERVARAKERNRRAEELAAAQAEQRHNEAIEGAKEALARLIADSEAGTREADAARAAGLPAPQRPRGIPGHEYEFADLTEERRANARRAWEQDLDVVRNLNAEDESLTTWRVDDIEDPRARAAVQHFVEQVPRGKKRQLIVVGSVGAGKTATAIAAGHAAVDRGIPTRYVSHNAYLECLRPKGSPPGGLSADEYRRAMSSVALLVLDDFCADMNTDVAASEFARRETIKLLNDRMTQGRSTIVTTNVTTEQVRTIMDDRVASRLGTNAVVVTMVEKDRRQPATW